MCGGTGDSPRYFLADSQIAIRTLNGVDASAAAKDWARQPAIFVKASLQTTGKWI